jgi:hypothetical protein
VGRAFKIGTGLESHVGGEILYDGTDLNFAYSFDGTQYNTIFSATPAAFIGSNPDTCGLHFGNLVSLPDFTNQGATDYFRRTF